MPQRPSLGRAAGARYPLAVGAGAVGVGTSHQPNSARSCELDLPAVGASRGRPGEGTSCLGFGHHGVGRSPIPDQPSLGRAAGARYPLAVGAGGCGRGDSSPTPQCVLLRAGLARCAGGTSAPLALVWGAQGWALSHARPPVLAACGRGLLPTGSGCGGCGCVDQSEPSKRGLLRACCALCGGGTGAPGGGGLLPGFGASGVGRSLAPPPPFLRARGQGPLPTGCRCLGVSAWGPASNSTARTLASWLCALWERHENAWRGEPFLPRCGTSGVGRSQTPDRPSLGRAGGACYTLAVCAGGVGMGARHQRHSARSCKLALRAVGAA